VPALAFALAYFGSAVGGVIMGYAAERVGIRLVVIGGALMIALALTLSSFGGATTLWIAHGVCIGLLGNACINAPLYVYVARWFDRRRGSAVALFSSGQNLAGAIWTLNVRAQSPHWAGGIRCWCTGPSRSRRSCPQP
jgi:MFS family permease